jgi:hypothetical protein
MKCSVCEEEMKYIKNSTVNLGMTVQSVFYCKQCNRFVTVSYGNPMEVRSQTEGEYYSIVL